MIWCNNCLDLLYGIVYTLFTIFRFGIFCIWQASHILEKEVMTLYLESAARNFLIKSTIFLDLNIRYVSATLAQSTAVFLHPFTRAFLYPFTVVILQPCNTVFLQSFNTVFLHRFIRQYSWIWIRICFLGSQNSFQALNVNFVKSQEPNKEPNTSYILIKSSIRN